MYKSFVLALVMTAGTIGLQAQSTFDEGELYRLALEAVTSSWAHSPKQRHVIVAVTVDSSGSWSGLDEETLIVAPYIHPRTRITYAKPETVESFLAIHSAPKALRPELRTLQGFLLVDANELRTMYENGKWADFARRNRLTGSTISLSRIGVDKSESEALVYVSHVCGSLCGDEKFVFLERASGVWRVAKIDHYAIH